MKNKEQYTVISPDGFSIAISETHDTPELAWEAFEKWKSNYERQGYYSTVRGHERLRIPLDELSNFCSLKTIK